MISAYVVWGLATAANLLIWFTLIHRGRWKHEVGIVLVQSISTAVTVVQNYNHFAGTDYCDLKWRGMDVIGIAVSLGMGHLLSRNWRPASSWAIATGYVLLVAVKMYEYDLEDRFQVELANAIYSYRRWFALLVSYAFVLCLYHGRIGDPYQEEVWTRNSKQQSTC